jgi:hypothetical protein
MTTWEKPGGYARVAPEILLTKRQGSICYLMLRPPLGEAAELIARREAMGVLAHSHLPLALMGEFPLSVYGLTAPSEGDGT